ncbi:hypothetical protein AMS68_006900 [Peltaster fructicola]|uniref:FAD-binding FR-type domain-containing protein n=1 Tax=Peltaster fructicola TaxID=286661 RepID=A0A6H0Y2Z7_9PEZI|nr:hypothetical protein AMS68_006900 [Peltaster fructicola]
MKSRLACRHVHIQIQHVRHTRLPYRRCFTQQHRYRNDDVKYEAPGPAEGPKPKATVRSRATAVLVGAGIALAYAAYKRRHASIGEKPKASDGFAKFTLVDKEAVSSTCSIFTLKPVTSRLSAGTNISADGGIYSVQLKQPQLQIARSYTMLPPIPGEPIDTLRLLIRKEEKGEVSGYLHTLALGQDIEVRGPYKDYAFPKNTKQVIFLAGGTGIAPALKTADALASKADVHVLWASRKREDCPGAVSDTPVDQGIIASTWTWLAGSQVQETTERNTIVLLLDILKQQARTDRGSLKVDYFVDEEQCRIRPGTITRLLQSAQADNADKLIFVSGPEGFINYWAGPKQFVNGREEQGKLGGALSRMNLQGWQVVKL